MMLAFLFTRYKLKTRYFPSPTFYKHHHYISSIVNKLISILVIVSLLIPSLGFAFNTPGEYFPELVSPQNHNPAFDIDPSIGQVIKSFKGNQSKSIFFIQDLHCNYEVQKNIAAIIGQLNDRHQIKLIGVEGSSQPIPIQHLSTIPNLEIRDAVGEYFLERGRITGAEFEAATNNRALLLQGIETEQLYSANKSALLNFLNAESLGYVMDLHSLLEQCKSAIYTKELKHFDNLLSKYNTQKITLNKYALALLKQANLFDINHQSKNHLHQFLKAQPYASTVFFDHEQLLSICLTLDQLIRNRLYTHEDQLFLDQLIKRVDLLEKLFNISLTSNELTLLRSQSENYQPGKIISDLQTLSYSYDLDCPIDLDGLLLSSYIEHALTFYDLADQRSAAFVHNLLATMNKHDQDQAVLISGGFHRQHVEHYLEQAGITYATIKPAITKTDVANPYFSIILNQRQPIEKLITQAENLFAPASEFRNPQFLKYLKIIHELIKEYTLKNIFKLKGAEYYQAEQEYDETYTMHDPSSDLVYLSDKSKPEKHIYVYRFKTQLGKNVESCIVHRPVGETSYPTLTEKSEPLPILPAVKNIKMQMQLIDANLLKDSEFLNKLHKSTSTNWKIAFTNLISKASNTFQYAINVLSLIRENIRLHLENYSNPRLVHSAAVVTLIAFMIMPFILIDVFSSYGLNPNNLMGLVLLPLFLASPNYDKFYAWFKAMVLNPDPAQLHTFNSNLPYLIDYDEKLNSKVQDWCSRHFGYAPLFYPATVSDRKHSFDDSILAVMNLALSTNSPNNTWLYNHLFVIRNLNEIDISVLAIYSMIYHEAYNAHDKGAINAERIINKIIDDNRHAEELVETIQIQDKNWAELEPKGQSFFAQFVRSAQSATSLEFPTNITLKPIPGLPPFIGFLAQRQFINKRQQKLIQQLHPKNLIIENEIPYPSPNFPMRAKPFYAKTQKVIKNHLKWTKSLGVKKISFAAQWDYYPRTLNKLIKSAQAYNFNVKNVLEANHKLDWWTQFQLYISWPSRHQTSPIITFGLSLFGLVILMVSLGSGTIMLVSVVITASLAMDLLIWGSYHRGTLNRLVVTIDSIDFTNRDYLAARLARRFGLVWVSDNQIERALIHALISKNQNISLTRHNIKHAMELTLNSLNLDTDYFSKSNRLHFYLNNKDITSKLNEQAVTDMLTRIKNKPELEKLLEEATNTTLLDLRKKYNLVVSGLNTGNLFGNKAQKRIWMMPQRQEYRAIKLYEKLNGHPPKNKTQLKEARKLLREQDSATPPKASVHTFEPLWDVSPVDLNDLSLDDALDRTSSEIEKDLHHMFSLRSRWHSFQGSIKKVSGILNPAQGEHALLDALQKKDNLILNLWDLDGLGSLNDIYGKQAVNVILDNVLKNFSQILDDLPLDLGLTAEQINQINLIRQGGDEIYVQFPADIDNQVLQAVGNHIKVLISASLHKKFVYLTSDTHIEDQASIQRYKDAFKSDPAIHVIEDDLFGIRFLVQLDIKQKDTNEDATDTIEAAARAQAEAKAQVNSALDQHKKRIAQVSNNVSEDQLHPLSFLSLLSEEKKNKLDPEIYNYLDQGWIVTPSLSGGSVEAIQTKPEFESKAYISGQYEQWLIAIAQHVSDALHIAKKKFKKFHFYISDPNADQLDAENDHPDVGHALSLSAQKKIKAELAESKKMGRLKVFDKHGKPLYDPLAPWNLSHDNLRAQLKDLLQKEPDQSPQVLVARAPVDIGPDKVQLVIYTPAQDPSQNTGRLYLLELEGSYNGQIIDYLRGKTALNDKYVRKVISEDELATYQIEIGNTSHAPVYKFKLLNDLFGYNFADSLIQWLQLQARTPSQLSLLKSPDFQDNVPDYINDYLKKLRKELNRPDNLANINIISTLTSIPTKSDPSEEEVNASINQLFKMGKIASLGKQGTFTLFYPKDPVYLNASNVLLQRARQAQDVRSNAAATKLFETLMIAPPIEEQTETGIDYEPAQLRMIKAIESLPKLSAANDTQYFSRLLNFRQAGHADSFLLYAIGGLGLTALFIPLIINFIAGQTLPDGFMWMALSLIAYLAIGFIGWLAPGLKTNHSKLNNPKPTKDNVLSTIRNWQLLGNESQKEGMQPKKSHLSIFNKIVPRFIWPSIRSVINYSWMINRILTTAKAISRWVQPTIYLRAWTRIALASPTDEVRLLLKQAWANHYQSLKQSWSLGQQKAFAFTLLHGGLAFHPKYQSRAQLLLTLQAIPGSPGHQANVTYQGKSFALPTFIVTSPVLAKILRQWGVIIPILEKRPIPNRRLHFLASA